MNIKECTLEEAQNFYIKLKKAWKEMSLNEPTSKECISAGIKDNSYRVLSGWVESYEGSTTVVKNGRVWEVEGIRHSGNPWAAIDGKIRKIPQESKDLPFEGKFSAQELRAEMSKLSKEGSLYKGWNLK